MMRHAASVFAILACLISTFTTSAAQDVAPEQRTISGEARVIDGDSISIQGRVFRLDGIDAPEIDQSCLDDKGQLYPCGRVAAQELSKLIGQQHVQCEDRGPDTRYKKRRIGGCYAFDGNDINRGDGMQSVEHVVWRSQFSDTARVVEQARLKIGQRRDGCGTEL